MRVWLAFHFLIWLLAVATTSARGLEFEFIVIGDTRPFFEREDFRGFQQLIPKMNAAKPAFIINLGDLIYGYGLLSKETQWNKYQAVLKQVEPPYYQLPGNHDTFSKKARRVYGRRFGKFYRTFDYGDCHFVLLDSTEDQKWGAIGAAQLDWLKRDLAANQLANVFVFTHFPVWETERVNPKYHQLWQEVLHPLFREHRVRAVFGGHYHSYGPSREFDGIHYYITGGGGAELRSDYRKSGGEHHFIKVRVKDTNHEIRVVTSRGEVSDAEADLMGGFSFADRHSSRIGIPRRDHGLLEEVPISVSISNPWGGAMEGKGIWDFDRSALQISPEEAVIHLSPMETKTYDFRLKVLRSPVSLASLPRLQFSLTGVGRHVRFFRELLFLEQMQVSVRRPPPILDGSLNDWGGVSVLHLDSGSDAQILATHDAISLYLAIVVPLRKATEEEDESAFPDDLQIGIARRTHPGGFGGDAVRLGLAWVDGRCVCRDRMSGRSWDRPLAAVRSACRRSDHEAVYEMEVPLSMLKASKAGEGNRLIVNLSFPVSEPDEQVEGRGTPQQNSFAYQVRYGSDSLVPVHFLELVLDPAPKPSRGSL